MRIIDIDVASIRLPFRFAFGHSLASRSFSDNLVVRVKLEDGTVGYGEGIPRDYVTGETIAEAGNLILTRFAAAFLNHEFADRAGVLKTLSAAFVEFGLASKPNGAAWCALELAILDATTKYYRTSVVDWLGGLKQKRVRYGAVVPFCGKKALLAILLFYRAFGFQTVKVKVGQDLAVDGERLQLVRRIMGPAVSLRVDANCAWSLEQALQAADRFRPFAVLSYEQPVAPEKVADLVKITQSIPEEVIVDESLCTIAQAKELARAKACTGFNIRVSKVGGLLAASQIADIAFKHGINCHLGAQVGESGILSAAARAFACAQPAYANYEGSDNSFLLKYDLTQENWTVGYGGWGRAPQGPGLGTRLSLWGSNLFENQKLAKIVPCEMAVAK